MSNNNDIKKDETNNVDAFASAIDYPEPFHAYALALCESASRYVCILSPQLDHAAFDHSDLADALSALARSSRQTQVRILLRDSRPVVTRGHRLLQLARRLPSTIKIHVLKEHPDWNGQTLVIRDRNGVLYRPEDGDNSAFYEPDSRASTQRHQELFDELWRYSENEPELRSINL